MRLDSIELENYRCYRRFRVSFQPGFNVIAGINGSGKTSLLKGIREALAPLPASMRLSAGHFGIFNDQDMAYVQPESSDGRYRFEPQYPVKVKGNGEILGQSCSWSLETVSQPAGVLYSGQNPGQIWTAIQQKQASGPAEAQQVSSITLPILAFYAAYRNWPPVRPNEMSAATERLSRTDAYRSWWDAASDSAGLQQWCIAKSMERLQLASDRAVRWDDINDDELALVNVALARVVEGAKGLRYDFSQKSLLIEWSNGASPTAFQNLSDGQRVAICLVTDIARRMCVLNPHLGFGVTQLTPGVVLIDELDIHLHPKWQRFVTKGLTAAFRSVQFVAASHSPQVLGELQPEEIILLRSDGASHPQVSYGLDSSRVLELIMAADSRSSQVNEALSALYESIERNELTKARELLTNLKASAQGIPELAGAEALLKRKEVIGR